MRSMRTVAGPLDIVLGVALVVVVAIVVNLDFPVNVVAWVLAGLMGLAGIGVLSRATWGARLGQTVGVVGALLGILIVVGAAFAFAMAGAFSALAGTVLLVLGGGLLVAFGAAFAVNRAAARAG